MNNANDLNKLMRAVVDKASSMHDGREVFLQITPMEDGQFRIAICAERCRFRNMSAVSNTIDNALHKLFGNLENMDNDIVNALIARNKAKEEFERAELLLSQLVDASCKEEPLV